MRIIAIIFIFEIFSDLCCSFQTRQWSSNGGKMNTAREGGSTLNVGSYIMSFGGFNTFGQPVNNVEIFDPRRPLVGWQNVPQWSFPRATRDHCTVVSYVLSVH